jgi:hypothetical protein
MLVSYRVENTVPDHESHFRRHYQFRVPRHRTPHVVVAVMVIL